MRVRGMRPCGTGEVTGTEHALGRIGERGGIGLIGTAEVVDQRLRSHTSGPAPGEETPHLDGDAVEVVSDRSLDGASWTRDEVSRLDNTPALEPEPAAEPEPASEPEPQPEPELVPAPGACERLGFPGEDEGRCSQILADISATGR